jgi:uncharacterized DUF497 family protein
MSILSRLGIPDHEFRVIFGKTEIEFDRAKEEGNRMKHGYSLESAVDLLEQLLHPAGSKRPYIVSDAFSEGDEVRHMHMSLDDAGKVVLMVTTMRPDEYVRVISFRRAHPSERIVFVQHTGYSE